MQLDTELKELYDKRGLSGSLVAIGRRGKGRKSDFSLILATIVDLEQILITKRAKLTEERSRIEDAMDALSSEERQLIRRRYFQSMGWTRIGIAMEKSYAQVHRIHSSALQKLDPDHGRNKANKRYYHRR